MLSAIIQSESQYGNSHSSFVGTPTTNTVNKWVPKADFNALKRQQHLQAKQLSDKYNLKLTTSSLLSELINCADRNLQTRVSQATLAKRLRCSISTIKRHLAKLLAIPEPTIRQKRRGWKQTNTITLLFIKHLNNHKELNLNGNLTPQDTSLKGSIIGGDPDHEKREASAALEARDSPPDDPFDDCLLPKPVENHKTEENIRHSAACMDSMRAILKGITK